MGRKTQPSVPNDLETVVAIIDEIGRLQREIVVATKKQDDRIAAIKATTAEYTMPRQRMIDDLAAQVAAYAALHRSELLTPGTKTKQLPSGTIRWAQSRPAVTLKRRRKIKDVVDYIASLGSRFAWMLRRPEPELNREAILERGEVPDELKDYVGISKGAEVFYITPHGSSLPDISIKL